jgi:hypothetical protein
LCGITESFGDTNGDAYAVKTDLNCDTIWTIASGGNEYDSYSSVACTKDNNYFFAGNTRSYGAVESDAFICSFSSSKKLLGYRLFGDTLNDCFLDIEVLSDDNLVLTGYTSIIKNSYNYIYIVQMPKDSIITRDKELNGEVTRLISLYPNPTDNRIFIKFNDNSSMQNIGVEVLNIHGSVLFKEKLHIPSRSFEIDVSNYNRGIYILKIIISENRFEIYKFLLI